MPVAADDDGQAAPKADWRQSLRNESTLPESPRPTAQSLHTAIEPPPTAESRLTTPKGP